MSDIRISPYLVDSRFSKDERELLFQLGAKTVSVKENFKNAFLNNNMLWASYFKNAFLNNNMFCDLYKLFSCTQSHPRQCPLLKTRIIVDKKLDLSDKFLYGDVDQQLVYVKIYKQFWDLREEMISAQANDEWKLSQLCDSSGTSYCIICVAVDFALFNYLTMDNK